MNVKSPEQFSEQFFKVAVFAICVAGGALLSLFSNSNSPAVALTMRPLQDKAPLEKPPEDQTYIGSKQCSACHFDQYMTWRQTKHAKATEILPARYKEDASCLECHSTGFGKPTGFKDATSLGLEGTSCEACHGPGSKHAEIAKAFADKKLTEEQSLYVRSTIYKLLPDNSCVKCHKSKGHVPHPDFDKE
jgi:hypothetical protein